MPTKPLLTPQQIADKFVNVKNPFCVNEKRAVADIRADLVEYIEIAVKDAVDKMTSDYWSKHERTPATAYIPEIPY